jgi:hypothetical protein
MGDMAIQGYTKLFSSIVTSTIWSESNETRLVWITMLALSDKNGIVPASVPGLANLARTSVEKCEEALAVLSSPDKYSRTVEFEGRRIEKVDGGWRLLNHGKYRRMLSEQERREYLATKQREYRSRSKMSTNVTDVSDTDTMLTHTDSDTDSDTKEETHKPMRVFSTPNFEKFWESYPYKIDKAEANKVWHRIPFAEEHADKILAGLEVWKASDRWKEPQYVPSPVKFLSNRRWETLPPKKAGSKSDKTKQAIERLRADRELAG